MGINRCLALLFTQNNYDAENCYNAHIQIYNLIAITS